MSLLEELKTKRQDAIENVAAQDLDIEATKATLAQEQELRAFWVARIADLDRAIAALSVPEVAEVEIPEGFVKWEGGECPFFIGTHLEVFTRKNGVWPVVIKPEAPLLWEHEGHDLDIIAYRVLPIEPAGEGVRLPTMDDIIDPDLTGGLTTEEYLARLHAGTLEPASSHAEGYAPVMGEGSFTKSVSETTLVTRYDRDDLVAGFEEINGGGIDWAGFDEQREAKGPATPDPLSISASETHAAESDAVKGQEADFWAKHLVKA